MNPKPKPKTARTTQRPTKAAGAVPTVAGAGVATTKARAEAGADGADGACGAAAPVVEAGIRVLCVDDHAVLVEGLKAQFSLNPSVRCIGWLPSAERLLEEVARLKPDVVLLDIEMPGPDAFEMADRLRHMHPGARVIILSAHIRDGYIATAFKCGAWGYFAKSDDLKAIVAGIREVATSRGGVEGTFVLGPKVKERCRPVGGADGATGSAGGVEGEGRALGDRFSMGKGTRRSKPAADARGEGGRPGAPTSRLDALSVREVEVLRLVGKGLSRSQIAAELARAVKTVDGHQDNIMRKLGVESRAELMRLAIREGFAEL
jgi:DNA-binding NarL/FixJ family response regulator